MTWLHRPTVLGRRIAHTAARIVANRARDETVAFELTQLCGEGLVRDAVERPRKFAETARRLQQIMQHQRLPAATDRRNGGAQRAPADGGGNATWWRKGTELRAAHGAL
jgi:hypothetical protein